MVLTAARPGAASWTRIIARDQSDVMAFGPRLVVTWQPAAPPAWLAPKLLTLPSAESPVIASAA
jgi:hypothetical protein